MIKVQLMPWINKDATAGSAIDRALATKIKEGIKFADRLSVKGIERTPIIDRVVLCENVIQNQPSTVALMYRINGNWYSEDEANRVIKMKAFL